MAEKKRNAGRKGGTKGKMVTVERTRKGGKPVKVRMGKAEELIQKGQKPVDTKAVKKKAVGAVGRIKGELETLKRGLFPKKETTAERLERMAKQRRAERVKIDEALKKRKKKK
jgi:hypothetical protein